MMSHSSTFLLPDPTTDNAPAVTHALVVLNRGLPRFTPLLWKHAQVHTCADDGANRLYDELPLLFPDEDALAIRKRHLGPSTRAYVALQLQHPMILSRTKILDPRDIKGNPLMIYMKGIPELPRCGFSALAVRVLKEYNVPLSARNILEDTELKSAVKSFRYKSHVIKGDMDSIREDVLVF